MFNLFSINAVAEDSRDWEYINWGENLSASLGSTFASGDTLVLKGSGAMYDFNIENHVKGLENTSIKHVIIDDGITNIGNRAFMDSQLNSVIIPNSVKKIGDHAFIGNNLISVNIPESVTDIGRWAFAHNQLNTVRIPMGITIIKDFSFANNKLKSIEIPTTVINIKQNAFARNDLLSVIIPDNVISIDTAAFDDNELNSIMLSNNLKSLGPSAFARNKLNSVIIPDSVVDIGKDAFDLEEKNINLGEGFKNYFIIDGTELKGHIGRPNNGNLIIPEGITKIGQYSFDERNLISLTLPESLQYIGEGAFNYNKLTSIILPNNLKKIETGAFNMNKLTSVFLPENITIINPYTFSTNEITSVNFNNQISSIGDFAFAENDITSIVLPDTLERIGISAFATNEIKSVIIPDSVVDIGENAFDLEEKNINLGEGFKNYFIIDGTELKGHIGRPNNGNLIIPEGITKIGNHAFSNRNLISVNIPESVTNIEESAFSNNQLISVNIPESVTNIGTWAFTNNQLSFIEIPNSVIDLGDVVFMGNSIKSIRLPSGLDIKNDNTLGDFGSILLSKYNSAGGLAGLYFANVENSENDSKESVEQKLTKENEKTPLDLALEEIENMSYQKEKLVISLDEFGLNKINIENKIIQEIINNQNNLVMEIKGISLNLDLANILSQKKLDIISKKEGSVEFSIKEVPFLETKKIIDNINKVTEKNLNIVGSIFEINLGIKTIDSDKKEKIENITTFIDKIPVSIYLENVQLDDIQKLVAVRYREEKEQKFIIEKLYGNYDEQNKTFSFLTDQFSYYGIIKDDSINKVIMWLDENEYVSNGVLEKMDVAPFLNKNITMVPLRYIAEALGANIEWDSESRTVVIKLDQKELSLKIASDIENAEKTAWIFNNRTIVPLRYFSEQLGSKVIWGNEEKSITIIK